MPTFTTESGRQYDVKGRLLIWHPDQDEDDQIADIRLPLRMKLRKLLEVNTQGLSGNEQAIELIRMLAPHQVDDCLEMDVNDFTEMFQVWQDTYNNLTGAKLGESSASSGSSGNTGAPSNTTSVQYTATP